MPNDKLLRPLHRRRKTRRPRASVLNSAELCESLAIERSALQQYLIDHDIAYHIDSQGEIWVSQEIR